MKRLIVYAAVVASIGFAAEISAQPPREYRSHPPLRTIPTVANRPSANGPAYYVDAQRGDDENAGGKDAPWQTLRYALGRLKAGDTLYLRGGVYYENARVCLIGRKDAPITVRSYPGEQAVLDGGMREFVAEHAKAWQPWPKGSDGEYRSTRAYPNLRHVLGSFGDSMIGLVIYYHAQDLRAKGETFDLDEATKDVKPIYCGPGVWYDAASGHLHARLAHTNVPGIANYRGESDPRKLPLVIAPFRSIPLRVDGARHVRFQDLVIRGGGYDTVVLDQADDIEFDNVTVWCGTYGIRATGARRLKFHRSALYGSIPPWLGRRESSLNSRPGSPRRDIARLNTHALLIPEAGREFSVYAFPFNDDWEISYSEFTDASDGLYLAGLNVRFHHNRVDTMQDDGLYLSPMYTRYERFTGKAAIHIYQNYFARALTALAFGGDLERTSDTIYFYRNIVDLRGDVNTGRPNTKTPRAALPGGHVMGDHGSPPWPAMFTYHNTFLMRDADRTADFGVSTRASADRPRRAFNNIYWHGSKLPSLFTKDDTFGHRDGNLFWQPGLDAKTQGAYFTKFRASAVFAASKKAYPPGFEAGSLVADPKFVSIAEDAKTLSDFRLQAGSSAVDAGVVQPADWPDPLRAHDKGRPDIGALPLDVPAFQAGRAASTSK